jgi:Cu+-exporting ATPase
MNEEKKDFSIDDILAEVDKKRGKDDGGEPPSFGVTEIIDVGDDALGVPRKPKKPDAQLDALIEPLESEAPAKKEKAKKAKKEKPEKPEKPEKVKKGDIVFKKAVVPPKPVTDNEQLPKPVFDEPEGYNPDEPDSEPEREKSNKGAAIQVGGEGDSEFEFPKLEITQVLEKLKPAPMDEALKKRGEALLERDMALEQPLEQIEALNPYEMLKIAADSENFADDEEEHENRKFISLLSGDTKGIADGDLKNLAEKSALKSEETTAEVVKTYIPSTPAAVVADKNDVAAPSVAESVAGHLSEKEKRSNTALIDSLNKALKEKRESDVKAYRTLPDIEEGPFTPNINAKHITHGLNIDYKKQVLTDTSLALTGNQPLLIEQKMNELKGKRKRKIRDFVLEDIEDAAVSDYDDEEDEYNDYDDYGRGGQIWNDLCETHKGLRVRFVILFVITVLACVVTFGNDLGIMQANVLGVDMPFLDKAHDIQGYLYLQLILGILGIVTCASVIRRGMTNLFTGKGDCDSLCAVPAIISTLSVVPLFNATGHIQWGIAEQTNIQINVFVAAGLAGLLFNTGGKLMMMARAKRNFGFVSGDNPKYYAEIIEDEQAARAFTKGVMHDLPILCTARKTEFLTDFLKNSYCNDKADQLSRVLAPAAFAAAIAMGLGALFLPYDVTALPDGARLFWALTAANAALCALSPLSMMFLVNNPLLRASKSLAKSEAVVLGYNSAEKFSKVNSILVDAQSLFPAGSVDFRNLKRCQQPNSLTGFAIDDAIITAASLAIKSGSILTSMFYDMIAGKSEMLYPIDNCIYEVNMGISGWMGNKRVMLGNRDQMKHHGIKVPDYKKEQSYAKKFGDVVYLASGGETIAMFFLKIVPNEKIKRSLQALQKQGVAIIVRTRDSLVTSNSLSEAFELNPENLRVIPFDLHEKFDDCTKYASRGDGNVACAGTFSSFAAALIAAKKIMHSILLSSSSVFTGLFLAVVFCVIFTLFGGGAMFSSTGIVVYNAFFFAAMAMMQGVKRY